MSNSKTWKIEIKKGNWHSRKLGFAKQFSSTRISRNRVSNWDFNFCKDRSNKLEVPDPLSVEHLISYKLNNGRKEARLIKQNGILVYTTQVNSTFRARWLASLEVISQVLFTSEQPKKNKVALVGILSQIKLLFGSLLFSLCGIY